jgi:uncharacterized damage-inducible protein DinB
LLHYVRNLVQYNRWANTKLAGFLKKLDPPLLDKEIVSSFNTIRKTLYHVWDAEAIWFNRLKGTSLNDWPSKSFNGNDSDALKGFIDQSGMFVRYTDGLSENDLHIEFSYSNLEGKKFTNRVADVLQHVMNHSTFHRGQLVTMLRNAGFTELSSTDFITFIREQ